MGLGSLRFHSRIFYRAPKKGRKCVREVSIRPHCWVSGCVGPQKLCLQLWGLRSLRGS